MRTPYLCWRGFLGEIRRNTFFALDFSVCNTQKRPSKNTPIKKPHPLIRIGNSRLMFGLLGFAIFHLWETVIEKQHSLYK